MRASTRLYVRRVVVRGVRTFAQTLAGVLTAAGSGLLEADWRGALSASGMAGLVAVLMNVGENEPGPETDDPEN